MVQLVKAISVVLVSAIFLATAFEHDHSTKLATYSRGLRQASATTLVKTQVMFANSEQSSAIQLPETDTGEQKAPKDNEEPQGAGKAEDSGYENEGSPPERKQPDGEKQSEGEEKMLENGRDNRVELDTTHITEENYGKNETQNCKEIEEHRRKTAGLFHRGLTKEEYNRRNWMWIRCRTRTGNRFDVGGSWFGKKGELLHRLVKKNCGGAANWRFKYVNGLDYGDAIVAFDWLMLGCDQRDAVKMVLELAKVAGNKYKRELYIWDCPGLEDQPNYGTERPHKTLWPDNVERVEGNSKSAPYNSPDYAFAEPYGPPSDG